MTDTAPAATPARSVSDPARGRPKPRATSGARSAAKGKPRRAKGQGQWALGHLEPLNPNEQVKKDDNGLNVRDRIINRYAHTGFASIDPADLRGRFRWYGLYTQRKPGIPGGRTASLEPHELDDEFFMLRIRSDGGRLSTDQARAIADISTEFARDTADVTDRQNIQLHWIRIEDVPEIWARLEAVGLSTTEACGDTPRVILGSALAGIAADEVLDPTPAIAEITARFIGDTALSNLPRKFKTAISGLPDVAHEINDVSFIGVEHPEHGPGFDLWVGGGLSTAPRLATRLGAWVPLAEVPEVWKGVVEVFRDYGYRRLRNRARLKFLVADWGEERFRQVLEDEYLGRRLLDGPAVPAGERVRDHVGVHPQRDGRRYVGVAPRVGRISGSKLRTLVDLAEAHGSRRLRLTPMQKIVVLDVPTEQVEDLVAGLDAIDLPPRPSPFRQSTMACTGLEYCKLAIVETKVRADDAVCELEKRLDDLADELAQSPVTLHVNGCPNSCARIQVADIGLKGMIVTDADGQQVEGFQVHLGGGLGLQGGFGRKLRGHKVTATDLVGYVERVVRRFVDERDTGETFAAWVGRADEKALR